MKRVLILVEGQTEETFVARVLAEHLRPFGVFPVPCILKTKRAASGTVHRGGMVGWDRAVRQINELLEDSAAVGVSTMFDFYGMPFDYPGRRAAAGQTAAARASAVQQALDEQIGRHRFRAYVQSHEFEALLFVAPSEVAARAGDARIESEMARAVAVCGGPEHVNDGPETAPSKRIHKWWPGFTKPIDGVAIVERTGIGKLRAACPNFDAWLTWLEGL